MFEQQVLPTLLIVLAVIAVIILLRSVRLTQEWNRAVVLRLGRFHAIKGPGLYLVFPIIDVVAFIVDMRVETTTITPSRR